jgi:hypothetical protein
MSASLLDPCVSISTSGYEDGLGRRTLVFDREGGGMLERLHVRPELVAFEASLRERMERLAAFEDERFARVQNIERTPDGGLIVVSRFVVGTRVCDLLDAAAGVAGDDATSPGIDAALGFLLEILPALAALHSTGKIAHGAVAPGRLTLTPAGQVIVLDSLFGQALERLQFNRRRLWSEFQIAMPSAARPAQFNFAADVSQASLTAMMIVVGRMFREDELPHGLSSLVAEVVDIAQIAGSTRFASRLQGILQRTLPLPTRRPYASADEAAAEVRQLAQEIGIPRCRAALTAFIADMSPEPDFEFVEDAADPIPVAAHVAAREPEPAPQFVVPLKPIPVPTVAVAEPAPAVAEFAPAVAAAEPDALLEMLAVLHTESPTTAVPDDATPESETDWTSSLTGQSETTHEPVIALEPVIAFEPVIALEPEPEAVATTEPVPAPHVQPEPSTTRRKPKRGGKRGRDKLHSAAIPPAPVVVPLPVTRTPFVPVDTGLHGRVGEPLRQDFAPQLAPIPTGLTRTPVSPTAASTPAVRVKSQPPAGYAPAAQRSDHRDTSHRDISGIPYVQRGAPEGVSPTFPRKLAAAALIIMVVGVGIGRVYIWKNQANAPEPTASTTAPTRVSLPALPPATGSVDIVTQPAGTRVLVDGQAAGETPLTIDSLPPGRHILTFVTASGSLKKTVRIESGKTTSLEVAVYSGWVAVFAPIPLDISENGRGIGTTEEGHVMLAPGRHQLTLSNRELGYSSVQKVEIQPGEESAVTVQPVGELNANALPWAEVWIDGKKAGETPIAHLQVPLGTHEIVFKHPELGERRMTVQVTATAAVAVSADFTKPLQP